MITENLGDSHVLPSTWMDSSGLSRSQPLQVHDGLQINNITVSTIQSQFINKSVGCTEIAHIYI